MIGFLENHLTCKEYADKVKSYPQKIVYYLNTGKLEGVKFHKRWYLHKDELKAWPPEARDYTRKS